MQVGIERTAISLVLPACRTYRKAGGRAPRLAYTCLPHGTGRAASHFRKESRFAPTERGRKAHRLPLVLLLSQSVVNPSSLPPFTTPNRSLERDSRQRRSPLSSNVSRHAARESAAASAAPTRSAGGLETFRPSSSGQPARRCMAATRSMRHRRGSSVAPRGSALLGPSFCSFVYQPAA